MPTKGQFRNRHKLEIYRLVQGATFNDPDSQRQMIGDMYADRRDFTGFEIAQNAQVPGFAETVMFYAPPTFRYNLPRPSVNRRDTLGEAPIGSIPVGGDIPGGGAPHKTVGVPYRRGDYIKDVTADEVFKITAIRDTSTQQRRVEITARRTGTQ